MSHKLAKRIRHQVKKRTKRTIVEFLKGIQDEPLKKRLVWAWRIIIKDGFI